MNDMMQYSMTELSFEGKEPAFSQAQADIRAVIIHGEKEWDIDGFYAGNGIYKVRFLPEYAGKYEYKITGEISAEGSFIAEPHDEKHHGIVRAEDMHLRFADGTLCTPFGTTVYAMMHQKDELIEETLRSLETSPFDKIRLCVFPKDYDYNKNDPEYYPFERTADGWNVHRPDHRFWDRFEKYLGKLSDIGFQVDLILFHPYDRWGFSGMSHSDDIVYLDYLLRRFSAYPDIWWSLANEYDLCFSKTDDDWDDIGNFITEHDKYHHLLSNHHCIVPWDHSKRFITHACMQTSQLERIAEYRRRYGRPVLIDECCYEGDLVHMWGNISGEEMTARFWKCMTQGGYCTHGETFLNDDETVFWSKGGTLKGESPERIRFLKNTVNEINGPIEPLAHGLGQYLGYTDEELMKRLSENGEQDNRFLATMLRINQPERDRFLATQFEWAGHCGERVYIYYYYRQCRSCADIILPENKRYRVDVLDTWEMTRKTVLDGVSGKVRVKLPAKEYMAVIASEE